MTTPGGPVPRGPSRRLESEQRLLALVRESWGHSQADLARLSGLSTATVSNAVARLLDQGEVTCASGVRGGRRVRVVSYAGDRSVYAGIDIGRGHVRYVVGDGAGRLLTESATSLAAGHRPSTTMATIRDHLLDLVSQVAPGVRPRALGVGLPGPLDRSTWSVVSGTILPGWVGVPIADELADIADTVLVENDANLGALATQASTGKRDLVYVKAGSGVGAGLIVDGRLRTGATGLAGELGHVTVSDVVNSPMCRCGRRGCLETYASTETLARTLSTVLDRRVRLQSVVGMAASADPTIRRVFDDAGEAIGRGLGILCTLLDPGSVHLGGQLAGLGPRLLNPVRTGFARSTLPTIADRTGITLCQLGDRAEALGALQLARTGSESSRGASAQPRHSPAGRLLTTQTHTRPAALPGCDDVSPITP